MVSKDNLLAQDRIPQIDIVKAVCAYLVCYSHFNSFTYSDNSYWFTIKGILGYATLAFSAYAVPLFLLINGYLIIHKYHKLIHWIRKIIHLFFITFVWGLLYNIIFNVYFSENKSVEEIANFVFNGVYVGEYISIRNWFFYTLIIIYLFLPFLHIIFSIGNKLIIQYLFGIVFCFTIGVDLVSKLFHIVEFIFNFHILEYANFFHRINIFTLWDSFALTYFVMGGVIFAYKGNAIRRLSKTNKTIGIIFSYILLVAYGFFYMKGEGAYYNIVWNGYPSIMLFVGATIAFVTILDIEIKMPKRFSRGIEKISKDSLGIYFIHLLIGTLLKPIYLRFDNRDSIVMGILFSVIVFVCSFAFCELLKCIPIIKYLILQ